MKMILLQIKAPYDRPQIFPCDRHALEIGGIDNEDSSSLPPRAH
jgi:hypothetical protein